ERLDLGCCLELLPTARNAGTLSDVLEAGGCTMKLRRLNNQGIERLSGFLDSLTTPAPQTPPYEILEDAVTSKELSVEIEVEKRTFASRIEVARYLDERFGDAESRSIERDHGVWAWLALWFFDMLCPPGRDGVRKPGARARWIPEVNNFRRYYRHLLAG